MSLVEDEDRLHLFSVEAAGSFGARDKYTESLEEGGRGGELNGDPTVTQLAMSWIRESWEEAGKEQG